MFFTANFVLKSDNLRKSVGYQKINAFVAKKFFLCLLFLYFTKKPPEQGGFHNGIISFPCRPSAWEPCPSCFRQ